LAYHHLLIQELAMTAIPRGTDTRQAVRALTKVIDQLFREIQQLRIEQYGLRGEIRKLACQTVPHEAALSGPYWEARAKALYDRGQDALEPTYPERRREIEEKLSIRQDGLSGPGSCGAAYCQLMLGHAGEHSFVWPGAIWNGHQDTGPREG
jgi:hypothetical protein